MAARKFDIVLTDGTQQTIRMTPKLFVMCERKWGKADNMPDMESMLYAAWIATAPATSFDEWMELVDEIIPPESEEESDDIPPPEAESAGSSPTSRSRQGSATKS
jgi:hypothetical protein